MKKPIIYLALVLLCALFFGRLAYYVYFSKQNIEHIPQANAFVDDSKFYQNSKIQNKAFKLLPPTESNIDFINVFKEGFNNNMWKFAYASVGSGLAIGDINNDGLVDVYFSSNYHANKLYLNLGNMQFKDISKEAGIEAAEGFKFGVSMVDLNADGFLDMYVCRAGHYPDSLRSNLLFINNGDLTFSEQAEKWGIASNNYSIQSNFFDYDLDGDLDMYLSNHPTDFNDMGKFKAYNKIEKGINQSDQFFINEGGHFREASKEVGINNHGYGLSCTVGDVNNDGYPDVYVSNDFVMNDHLYINTQDGKFKESIRELTNKTSKYSMGSDIEDINNDGALDILTVDINMIDYKRQKTLRVDRSYRQHETLLRSGFHNQSRMNCLQLNAGDGHFSEIAHFAGIEATDWAWSPVIADFDNDGLKDVFVSNGFYSITHADDRWATSKMKYANLMGLEKAFFDVRLKTRKDMDKVPNRIFKNQGDLIFEDQTMEWGFEIPSTSYGAAAADLDNDGDLDIVSNNMNQQAFIYENQWRQKNKHHFLQVDLTNTKDQNTNAICAKVHLVYADSLAQYTHFHPTRGYQSSSSTPLHFGLGTVNLVDTLFITWSDGYQEFMTNVQADQVLKIDKQSLTPLTTPNKEGKSYPNNFVKNTLDWKQEETYYDDFDWEFMLPMKLSESGPKITTGDVNSDGLTDFFVAAPSGQAGELFLQKSVGQFDKTANTAWSAEKHCEDTDILFLDSDGDGDQDILVASGGNELKLNHQNYFIRLYRNQGKGRFEKAKDVFPTMTQAVNTLQAIDIDKDGIPEIFVGAASIPRNYPMNGSSMIWQNKGGEYIEATTTLGENIKDLGIVTDAYVADINQDTWDDLIVIGEWMNIAIFENQEGKLVKKKVEALEQSNGWWKHLNAADLDGDGDLDFVLGNIGENFPLKPSKATPLELFYKDIDQNGTRDLILSFEQEGQKYPYFDYYRFVEQFPHLADTKLQNTEQFANVSLADLFSPTDLSESLLAYEFKNTILENLGNFKFKIHRMPTLAQLAPIFGSAILDVNSDGILDIVIQGNFFGTEPRTPTLDAGQGVVLLGKGNMQFEANFGHKYGFVERGEARDLELIQEGPNNILVSSQCNGPINVYTQSKE